MQFPEVPIIDKNAHIIRPAADRTPMAILGEIVKVIVLVTFAMYILGFVIWSGHLAKYGCSPSGLLKVEYLSAAFCYLGFFTVMALYPCSVIGYYTFRQLNPNISFKPILRVLLLCVWAAAIPVSFAVFFRDDVVRALSMFDLGRWTLIMCLLLSSFAGTAVWGELRGASLPLRIVRETLHFTGIIVIICLMSRVSAMIPVYLLITVAQFVLVVVYASNVSVVGTKQHQITLNHPYRKLTGVFFGMLMIIVNCHTFGKDIFQYIERPVGGGRPERALFRLSAGNDELASLLGLHRAGSYSGDTVTATNGFYGPVSIIMKTEKEIYFRTDAEPSKHINIDLKTILAALNRTNTPVEKPSAREIKSDLVEGIVFLNSN